MRLLPRSLFGRLLGIAALTTLAALLFASLAIGQVLERFVIHGLDQQLDAQIGILAKGVRPDGTLDRARVVDLPAFDEPSSEWVWRVDGPDGQRWSSAPGVGTLTIAPQAMPRHAHDPDGPPDAIEPRPGDARTPSGQAVHLRQLTVRTPRGPVLVTAAGPRRVALRPLREAMVPLLGSLALLGIGLAAATLLQLRVGLRPLRTLQAALADVREGRARHVPRDQPDEIAPLVSEMNALIDQNATQLEHARRHVSNLAHGLKTPLAALSIKLAEAGRDPDGSLGEMVGQIDGRIRHHLGRARAAAPGSGRRMRTLLAPAITDLCLALGRIHLERAIAVTTQVAPDLAVAVEPQDLDEMTGNLLDNAWCHARGAVRIAAARAGARVILTIDDDGLGLSESAIAEALVPGRRLDEGGDGHGFGLSIAQELAELSGGELTALASPVMPGPARDADAPDRRRVRRGAGHAAHTTPKKCDPLDSPGELFRKLNYMVQYVGPSLDLSFAALSDATRRGIIDQLGRADASITSLADRFQMTLTGMKKHVQVLERAGLVVTQKVGRVRTCKLGRRGLEQEAGWIEAHRKLFEARFDAMDDIISELKEETGDGSAG